MEVVELECWRIEVDDWYYANIAISEDENLQTALDTAIMLVEENFGRKVRNYYICLERNLIKVWIGLFK